MKCRKRIWEWGYSGEFMTSSIGFYALNCLEIETVIDPDTAHAFAMCDWPSRAHFLEAVHRERAGPHRFEITYGPSDPNGHPTTNKPPNQKITYPTTNAPNNATNTN